MPQWATRLRLRLGSTPSMASATRVVASAKMRATATGSARIDRVTLQAFHHVAPRVQGVET